MSLPIIPFNHNGLLKTLPTASSLEGWPWNVEVNPAIYDSKDAWPKITIVTPSYNQGIYLEQTIRSILLQNYPNLEYIVIDGGSTDSSLVILEKYSSFISYWISEKDHGQANAINKGLKLTSGDLFNWINSDDYLEPEALFELGRLFSAPDQILAGAVNNFTQHNEKYTDESYFGIIKNKNLNINTYFTQGGGFNFHQPGVWLGTQLLDSVLLDEKSHFVFDTKMILSILEKDPTVIYTSSILVNFRLHESSKTLKDKVKFGEDIFHLYQYYIDHGSKEISRKAKGGLDQMKWTDKLNKIALSPAPKSEKLGIIIQGILSQPTKRFTRFSLGCIKNILLS